jgi:hypothetical protein
LTVHGDSALAVKGNKANDATANDTAKVRISDSLLWEGTDSIKNNSLILKAKKPINYQQVMGIFSALNKCFKLFTS